MVSCKNRVPEEKVDIVYFGGTILTMGISDSVKDLKGGHYGRDKKTGKLNEREFQSTKESKVFYRISMLI